jgi:hypothetical protein
MSTKWNAYLATLPRLGPAEVAAVKEIVERHLAWLSSDYPRVDEAHYQIQQDLDVLTDKP